MQAEEYLETAGSSVAFASSRVQQKHRIDSFEEVWAAVHSRCRWYVLRPPEQEVSATLRKYGEAADGKQRAPYFEQALNEVLD